MPHTASATNQEIAERLGLTHSTVSRLRSGARLPSFETMRVIRYEFRWGVESQFKARSDGKYHLAFEQALVAEYGKAPDDVDAAS